MRCISNLSFSTLFVICFAFNLNAQTKYDDHLSAARATGIIPIKNTAHINNLVAKKKLVTLNRSKGYTIAKLTYSRPYITPKTNKILKQIGIEFYNKTKKTITITSVTRTLEDQRRLSRVNSNAVTTKLSSHNYGCSFDISYIRFNRKKALNPRLEKTLEDILIKYQKQKKLYFIKEYKERCFHVTVR